MSETDSTLAFLVTGASGFIGSHLVGTLQHRFPGATVVAQCRRNLPPASRIGGGAIAVTASLSDLCAVLAERTDLPDSFAGVFHLAAFIPKSNADDDAPSAIESNIVGTERLLAGMDRGTDRLVFASTVDVYGTPGMGEVVSEQSPLRPASLYAASKLFGELMVRQWAPMGKKRRAIVRVGHIYGPGEEAYRKLIPETIRRLLAGQPARLVGSGAELRDFLYVGDAVEALIRAWEMLGSGDVGPLNLVSGRAVTVRQTIEILCEEAGRPRDYVQEAAPGIGRSLRFDASLAEKTLGHYACTDFRGGIREEIEWVRRAMSRG